ncbi:hypothetical protein A5844_002170 [Enterococcus sp. 10A9_DIV0425]|uniref:Major facilitator superfamily (MFS) profile domain-containing protein n=1 Tax=Candidatus Enterococcus wittei TaxID=1987383 RepID=A0A242JZ22_9ENTE|nr:hypothetical protein [Enterococcus sp. 10A9_DIV0425]OTP10470.1 hypothetical protein A5844_002170 [Enterococcus sp. 10A9_DIV0425]THE12883.1 hypothetical protein E1H99_06685 [Enterococcus hirae]
MIRILMAVAALLLLFVSYYLFKKQPIFFVLIENNKKNQGFLQFFGSAYAFLGILGLVVAGINHRFFALLYLVIVIVVASVFSISFAKKMAKQNSK